MERSKKDDLESIWDKRVEILGTKEKKGFHSNQDGRCACYFVVTVAVGVATYLTGATQETSLLTVWGYSLWWWEGTMAGWQVATSHLHLENREGNGAGLTPFYSVWTQNTG